MYNCYCKSGGNINNTEVLMAAYFMGIDLGTSSIRAFVIDFDQNRTAVAGEGYDVQIPQLGYRSEEHTSELQSRVDISYAVFCLKK